MDSCRERWLKSSACGNILRGGVYLRFFIFFIFLVISPFVLGVPFVELTSPLEGQSYIAPATLTLSANATDSDGPIRQVEFYRGGSLIGTVTSAPYTIVWSDVPKGTYQLKARATDDQGKVTTSVVRSISVVANQAPSVELTAPPEGQSYIAPATLTLSANATDSDGTIRQVEFYRGGSLIGTVTSAPYTMVWSDVPKGTYQLKARATDDQGKVTTSAVRTITVKANQTPSIELTSPAKGTNYLVPATVILSAEASDSDGEIVQVEFYQGSTVIGTVTRPPYTLTWPDVPAGSYRVTAMATDDRGASKSSAAHSITIKTAAPSVALTKPLEGAEYIAPATLVLSAEAVSGAGTTLTEVSFYRGSTRIGTVTSAPYTMVWSDVPKGTYQLKARATDDQGKVTTSAVRSIRIVANQAPDVALTNPLEGQSYVAPATLTLSANATDSDGTIRQVEFYRGSSLIGTVTSAPYTMVWSDVPKGTYQLKARATDDQGKVTTSAVRTITVTNPALSVELTKPEAGQRFTEPATIELEALVRLNGGVIQKLEYYTGSALIGTVTTAPYRYTWTDVSAGSHSISVRVSDSKNRTATSAVRTIQIGGKGGSGAVYYIHSDHLDTPRAITDAGNRTVWRHGLLTEAFGKASPEEDPDEDGEAFVFNRHLSQPNLK